MFKHGWIRLGYKRLISTTETTADGEYYVVDRKRVLQKNTSLERSRRKSEKSEELIRCAKATVLIAKLCSV